VTLAQHLERKLFSEIEIVLISSENHLVFTPMLAELSQLDVMLRAIESLSPDSILAEAPLDVRRPTY
jgi:NADH dehydrogenase FAD-containing subunit